MSTSAAPLDRLSLLRWRRPYSERFTDSNSLSIDLAWLDHPSDTGPKHSTDDSFAAGSELSLPSDHPPENSRSSQHSLGPAGKGAATASSASTAAAAIVRAAAFHPGLQFQIETLGKAFWSLPLPPLPTPIPVYLVPEGEDSCPGLGIATAPAFISLRPTRGSGDCTLVSGSDDRWRCASASAPGRSTAPVAALYTLATTTYRFGPRRPPRVTLFGTAAEADCFDVDHAGLPLLRSSRVWRMHTRLGVFAWRYARRAERKAAAEAGRHEICSMLVMERIGGSGSGSGNNSSGSGSGSGNDSSNDSSDGTVTPVARLLRSAALRSRGSKSSAAGNGGRLQLDLRGIAAADHDDLVVLAVTTCLCMLKKEVDRCRGKQMAVMVATMSGGG